LFWALVHNLLKPKKKQKKKQRARNTTLQPSKYSKIYYAANDSKAYNVAKATNVYNKLVWKARGVCQYLTRKEPDLLVPLLA
jgi:hypothetical protein